MSAASIKTKEIAVPFSGVTNATQTSPLITASLPYSNLPNGTVMIKCTFPSISISCTNVTRYEQSAYRPFYQVDMINGYSTGEKLTTYTEDSNLGALIPNSGAVAAYGSFTATTVAFSCIFPATTSVNLSLRFSGTVTAVQCTLSDFSATLIAYYIE